MQRAYLEYWNCRGSNDSCKASIVATREVNLTVRKPSLPGKDRLPRTASNIDASFLLRDGTRVWSNLKSFISPVFLPPRYRYLPTSWTMTRCYIPTHREKRPAEPAWADSSFLRELSMRNCPFYPRPSHATCALLTIIVKSPQTYR